MLIQSIKAVITWFPRHYYRSHKTLVKEYVSSESWNFSISDMGGVYNGGGKDVTEDLYHTYLTTDTFM